jgi:hypothetical protein
MIRCCKFLDLDGLRDLPRIKKKVISFLQRCGTLPSKYKSANKHAKKIYINN